MHQRNAVYYIRAVKAFARSVDYRRDGTAGRYTHFAFFFEHKNISGFNLLLIAK